MAHEVTRDVTAWAHLPGLRRQNYSGIEPILQATCSRTWARLGSLSVSRQGAAYSHRRFDRDCFRRDHSPNGVAWRFPDWTVVGFAIPSPFLGSAPLGIPLPEHSRLFGLDPAIDGRLSLHGGRITRGDFNPDCLAWRFCALLLGWPGRWPPTFAVPAFICFARSFARRKPDSVVRSILLFRRSLSCPTTKGNISTHHQNPEILNQLKNNLSTAAHNSLSHKRIHGA